MTETLPEPKSRKEEFLAKAAGMDGITLPEPASREEEYLNAIAEGGGGGGGSYTAGTGINIASNQISVDTTTIQEKLTAGTNITISDNVISASGGGGVTPAQTTGTSTTDVMSQDATTKMIHPDIANHPTWVHIGGGSSLSLGLAINGTLNSDASSSIVIGSDENNANVGQNGRARYGIAIGDTSVVGKGNSSIAIGHNAYTNSGSNSAGRNIAIGANASINGEVINAVSLGAYAKATRIGEVNIGTNGNNAGYNSTDYRVIGGVHDGVNAHDAATVGQLGVKVLTAADYNWDYTGQGGTPNAIATWLLDDGVYVVSDINQSALGEQPVYYNKDLSDAIYRNALLMIANGGANLVRIDSYSGSLLYVSTDTTDGSILYGPFYLNLTEIESSLEELFQLTPYADSGAPDSSFNGTLGQLYTDIDTMHTYQCTAIDDTDPDNVLYTWTQRW